MINIDLDPDQEGALVVQILKSEWDDIVDHGCIFDDMEEERLLNSIEYLLKWFMSTTEYTEWRKSGVDARLKNVWK